MKTLILFLLPITMFSQLQSDYERNYKFASVSVDPQNLFWGSDKNSPGLDFVATIGANHENVRVAIFYERFELIKYQSYGIQPSLAIYPLRNVQALIGTEISMINRMGPTWLSYAFNLQGEYHFKRFFVGWKADLKRRTDVTQKWGYSNYVKIGFKF